jgi:hypothetical protein
LGRASEPAQVRRQTLEPPGGRQYFTSEESLLPEHSEVCTEVDRPKRKDEGNGRDSERRDSERKQTLNLPGGRLHCASEASNSQERFQEMDVGRGRVFEVVPSAVQPASDARAESGTRAERNEQDKNPRGAEEPARTEVTQERAEVGTNPEHERDALPYSVQLARADPSTGTERDKQRQQPTRLESREETTEGESVLQNVSVGAGRLDVGAKKKNADAAETRGATDQEMAEERAQPQRALGVRKREGKAVAADKLRARDRDVPERSAEREKGSWAELQAEKEATAERLWAVDPQPDVGETDFSTRERDGDVKDRGTEKRAEWRPDVTEAEPVMEKARVMPEGATEEQDTEKRVGTERKRADGALEREGGFEAPSALVRTPRKAIREGLSVAGINLEERQAQPHLQVERGASASLPEAAKPNGSGLPLKVAEQRNAAVVSGAAPGPYERGPAVEVGQSKLELERGWVSEGKQSLVDDSISGDSSRVLEKEEKRSSETAHRTARSVVGASEKSASTKIEGRRVGAPRDISDSIREAEEENARAQFVGAADEKPNPSDAAEDVLDEDTRHTGVQDQARAERALGFGVTTVVSDDFVEDVLAEESDFMVVSSGSEVNDALAPHPQPETEAINPADTDRLVHLEETQASETSSGLRSQEERSRLTAPSAFADVLSADGERPGLVGASDGSAFSAPATESGSASCRGANSLEETSPAESLEREGVNLRETPRDARSSLVEGRSPHEEVDLKATPRDAGATLVEGDSGGGDVSLDEIPTPASATLIVDGGSNQAANEPPLPVKGSHERDESLEDLEMPLDDLEYADVQIGSEPSTRSVAAEVFEVQYEDPLARLDVADIDEVEDQW